jgi:biotin carboxyl carrier protein
MIENDLAAPREGLVKKLFVRAGSKVSARERIALVY